MTRRLLKAALFAAILCAAAAPASAFARIVPARQSASKGVVGAVTEFDREAGRLVVKADSGGDVTVVTGAGTEFLRVPPGETTLARAERVTSGEVGAGDRIFARGQTAEDGKTFAARSVIVMSLASLEERAERARQDWEKRGIAGTVTAINAAAGELAIRRRGDGQTLTLTTARAGISFRRYAPDSVGIAEARAGTFGDIKVGDEVRARGDLSDDGRRFNAEEVVSGTFRTILATVISVNAAAGELRLTVMPDKSEITVVVGKGTVVKGLPPATADFVAKLREGAAAKAKQPGAPGAPARRERPRVAGIQEVVDKLPSMRLDEIQPGRSVMFTTTGEGRERVTAVQLVANVEPIFTLMLGGFGGPGGRPLSGFGMSFGMGGP